MRLRLKPSILFTRQGITSNVLGLCIVGFMALLVDSSDPKKKSLQFIALSNVTLQHRKKRRTSARIMQYKWKNKQLVSQNVLNPVCTWRGDQIHAENAGYAPITHVASALCRFQRTKASSSQ